MSTKKKRVTKQVRVERKVHAGLSYVAQQNGITISKLVSGICRPHIPKKLPKKKNAVGKYL